MTKKVRNLLFIFFVFLFITISSFAITYSVGYKINLTWPPKLNTALQKTGMFIIKTKPEGANVYLNNEIPSSYLSKFFASNDNVETPAKIKNLLPDEYNVKISKDGYWEWQKNLKIYPGQATIIEDIQLFKKELPMLVTGSLPNKMEISPNKRFISFFVDKSIYLLDLNQEKTINLYSFDNIKFFESDILWSSNSKNLIFNNIIFDVDKPENFIDLDKTIGDQISNLRWSLQDDSILYYQHSNSLNLFNINSHESKNIAKGEDYIDYLPRVNDLIYISRFNNLVKLKSIDLKNYNINNEIDLPFSENYSLLDSGNPNIHLYNNKFNILYLINFGSYLSPLSEIINNIKYFQWINDNQLLYANDFEIFIYDLEKNKKNLITRISDPILSISLHPNGNYIIYSTNKYISIIETEKQNQRNITELVNVENISNPYIDDQGDLIYFGAKISNQEGIYKLEL